MSKWSITLNLDPDLNFKVFNALVVLVIIAQLIAGCGESTSPTATPPLATDGEPTAQASEEGIPVGILLPLTGSLSWVADAIPAIELAVEEVNAAGGAAGQPISLHMEDSQAEDTAAISGMTKLLDVKKVVALIGPTSLTINSVISLVQQREVLEISPTAGTTALDTIGGQYIFRTISSDTVMGTGMVWYAVNELDAQKAALFFSDTGSASSISGVLKAAAQVLDLEIVADVVFPKEAPTYRAELQQVVNQSPDVIFFEASPESSAVFLTQANEIGIDATWVGTDFVNDPFAAQVTTSDVDIIGVNPAPVVTDRFNAWKDQLEEKRSQQGVPTFSANAYDAMIIIALAAEAAGEPTRAGILANVHKVANPPGEQVTSFAQGKALLAQDKDIDYEGIAGAQDFNEFGDVVTSLQVVILKGNELERTGTLTQNEIGEALEQVLTLFEQEQ